MAKRPLEECLSMSQVPTVKFTLVIRNEDGTGSTRRFGLRPGTKVRIGRNPKSEVVVEPLGVSNRHMELQLLPGDGSSGSPRLGIRDLSCNGSGLQAPGQNLKHLERDIITVVQDGSVIVLPMKARKDGAKLLEKDRTCFLIHLGDGPGLFGVPKFPAMPDDAREKAPQRQLAQGSAAPPASAQVAKEGKAKKEKDGKKEKKDKPDSKPKDKKDKKDKKHKKEKKEKKEKDGKKEKKDRPDSKPKDKNKRAKPSVPKAEEMLTCTICCEEKPAAEFRGKITAACEHARDVCRTCVDRTVDMEVNGKGNSTVILCPHSSCSAALDYADVRREARTEVFEHYDRLLLRKMLQKDAQFRWCSHPGCGSGQIVEDLTTAGSNVFLKCYHCSRCTCAYHRCVWHTERTCQQYEQDSRNSEEVALWQYFERENVKRCPHCHHAIEKSAGCDHMTCERSAGGCGAEFCFRCLADYNGSAGIRAVGNSVHKRSCPWYYPDRDGEGTDDSELN